MGARWTMEQSRRRKHQRLLPRLLMMNAISCREYIVFVWRKSSIFLLQLSCSHLTKITKLTNLEFLVSSYLPKTIWVLAQFERFSPLNGFEVSWRLTLFYGFGASMCQFFSVTTGAIRLPNIQQLNQCSIKYEDACFTIRICAAYVMGSTQEKRGPIQKFPGASETNNLHGYFDQDINGSWRMSQGVYLVNNKAVPFKKSDKFWSTVNEIDIQSKMDWFIWGNMIYSTHKHIIKCYCSYNMNICIKQEVMHTCSKMILCWSFKESCISMPQYHFMGCHSSGTS